MLPGDEVALLFDLGVVIADALAFTVAFAFAFAFACDGRAAPAQRKNTYTYNTKEYLHHEHICIYNHIYIYVAFALGCGFGWHGPVHNHTWHQEAHSYLYDIMNDDDNCGNVHNHHMHKQWCPLSWMHNWMTCMIFGTQIVKMHRHGPSSM